MKIRLPNIITALCMALVSHQLSAATSLWSFQLTGLGKVTYSISGGASGAITNTSTNNAKTGSVNVPSGSSITLDFIPTSGWIDDQIYTNATAFSTAIFNDAIYFPAFSIKTLTGNYTTGLSQTFSNVTSALFVNAQFTQSAAPTPTPTPSPTPTADPVGSFHFGAPTNSTNVTPVTTGAISYQGVAEVRAYNFDVTPDEDGKLIGIGSMEGLKVMNSVPSPKAIVTDTAALTPKTVQSLSPIVNFAGSLSTLKGAPTASLGGGINGVLDTSVLPVKSSGAFQVSTTPGSSNFNYNISGKGSMGTVPNIAVKNLSVNNIIPAGITRTIKKVSSQTWGFKIDLTKGTNARSAKSTYASSLLTLPTGTHVYFNQRVVKYSLKKGYNFSFTNGVLADGTGNPILNNKNKPTIVKKISLICSGVTFSGSGNTWALSGGTVNYKFMGQSGTGKLSNFSH